MTTERQRGVVAVATLEKSDLGTEFEPVYHRYTPHRAGLPPLGPYFRELWNRRHFATELSKAGMRAGNTTTFFGQAWLVLNPVLSALVYYLMVTIIRGQHNPGFFLHLTLTLFAFGMIQTAITSGSTSVTGSGKLLINTAFPRLLIPLSTVRTAFYRFLPTIPVFVVFVIMLGPWTIWQPRMLLGLYFLAMMVVFSAGLACFFAALQVYFRDTSQFLPFFVRLWMYLAPILWVPESLVHFGRPMKVLVKTNPLYPYLAGYSELILEGKMPPTWMFVAAAAWAFGVAVIAFWFFVSREREFAVRIT
jgi:teichoic acid transport system permease protein